MLLINKNVVDEIFFKIFVIFVLFIFCNNNFASTISRENKFEKTFYDYTPSLFVFTSSAYLTTIQENVRGKVYVHAKDSRMGIDLNQIGLKWKKWIENRFYNNPIKYKIISGDKQNLFKAESHVVGDFAFLRIRTRQSLDLSINRELVASYELLIKATMNRREKSIETHAKVIVKVLDSNDLSPLFSKDFYSIEIDPTIDAGSQILKILAKDPDEGLNGQVVYSLNGFNSYFSVNPFNGWIFLFKKFSIHHLSYEQSTKFTFEILAEDRASRLVSSFQRQEMMGNANFRKPASSTTVEIIVKPLKRSLLDLKFTTNCSSCHNCGHSGENLCGLFSLPYDLKPEFSTINKFNFSFKILRHNLKHVEFGLYSTNNLIAGQYDVSLMVFYNGKKFSSSSFDNYRSIFYNDTTLIFLNQSISIMVDDFCKKHSVNFSTTTHAIRTFSFPFDECSLKGSMIGYLDIDDDYDDRRFVTDFNYRFYFEHSDDQIDDDKQQQQQQQQQRQWFTLNETTGLLYLKANADVDFSKVEGQEIRLAAFAQSHICTNFPRIKYSIRLSLEICNKYPPVFTQHSCPSTIIINQHSLINREICRFEARDDDVERLNKNGKFLSNGVAYILRTQDANISALFEVDSTTGVLTMKRQVFDEFWDRSVLLTVQAVDRGPKLSRFTVSTIEIFFGAKLKMNNVTEALDLVTNFVGFSERQKQWSSPSSSSSSSSSSLSSFDSAAAVSTFSESIRNLPSNLYKPTFFDKNDTIWIERRLLLLNDEKKSIYRFDVRDNDSGFAGKLQYGIVDCHFMHRLRIDLYSGELYVDNRNARRHRDINQRQIFSKLTVKVCDLAFPVDGQLCAVRDYKIEIFDSNSPPIFDHDQYYYEIDENLLKNFKSIGRVSARLPSGPDQTASIFYHILPSSSSSNSPFRIDSTTGSLNLDESSFNLTTDLFFHEKFFHLTISADVRNSLQQKTLATAQRSILLRIKPTNVVVFEFSRNFYSFKSKVETKYHRVRWPKDAPVYSLIGCPFFDEILEFQKGTTSKFQFSSSNVGHDEKHTFGIDADSGCIYLKERFNFEYRRHFNVSIDRIFSSDFYDTFVLIVEIYDVAEDVGCQNLQFHQFAYSGHIFENEPSGTGVVSVSLSTESNSRIQHLISYSLIDGDGIGYFQINSSGHIVSSRSFDRETKSNYWLTVEAKAVQKATVICKETATVQVYVTVKDKNDNRPIPVKPYFESKVAENSPANWPIIKIEAWDADYLEPEDLRNLSHFQVMNLPTLNDKLTFKIAHGDPQSFFKIHQKTGVISTGRRQLDRESVSTFNLEISITDDGQPAQTSNVFVNLFIQDLNDNAPHFPSRSYECQIPGPIFNITFATRWIFACRIFAIDSDFGGTSNLSYSIIEGNNDDQFKISSQSGEIFIKTIKNDEIRALRILVSDDIYTDETNVVLKTVQPTASNVDEQMKKLRQNSAPILIKQNLTVHVARGEKIGARLTLIEATDPDNDFLWFYLKDNNGGPFLLKSDTGELQLAYYANQSIYHLPFIVTDGVLNVSGWLFITVQNVVDIPLYFKREFYEISVAENVSLGSTLFRLDNETENFGSDVRFFIYNNFSIDSSKPKFQIDPRMGFIYLVDNLDYEESRFFFLHVEARSNTAKAFVLLYFVITDVNDNKPKFCVENYEIGLPQRSKIGYFLTKLLTIDEDSKEAGVVRYSIISGNEQNFFHLNSQHGNLTLAKELPANFLGEFVLAIKAQDLGHPPLNDFSTLRVFVTTKTNQDGRLDSIRFKTLNFSFEIYENLTIGSHVGTLDVESDTPIFCKFLEYSKFFKIQSGTSRIYLISKLHYEIDHFYQLSVECFDSKNSKRSTNVSFSILDTNDHRPIFDAPFLRGFIEENSAPGSVVKIYGQIDKVLQIFAKDFDSNLDGSIVFDFEHDQFEEVQFFDIDKKSGIIRTKKSLDFETSPFYLLKIKACDQGNPSLCSLINAQIRVDILNLNDNAPFFISTQYSTIIRLPIVDNWPLDLDIRADDQDFVDGSSINESSLLKFGLISSEMGRFKIDDKTGQIFVGNSSLLISNHVYRLNLTVFDGIFTAFARLEVKTVLFEKSNDFGFMENQKSLIVDQRYSPDLSIDDQKFPKMITKVSVFGGSTENLIIYNLKASHLNDHFFIDNLTGEIFIKQPVEISSSFLNNKNVVTLFITAFDDYSLNSDHFQQQQQQQQPHGQKYAAIFIDVNFIDKFSQPTTVNYPSTMIFVSKSNLETKIKNISTTTLKCSKSILILKKIQGYNGEKIALKIDQTSMTGKITGEFFSVKNFSGRYSLSNNLTGVLPVGVQLTFLPNAVSEYEELCLDHKIDPCFSSPCQNQGICISLQNFENFRCNCSNGWTGSICTTKENFETVGLSRLFYNYLSSFNLSKNWHEILAFIAISTTLVLFIICLTTACRKRRRIKCIKSGGYTHSVLANDKFVFNTAGVGSLQSLGSSKHNKNHNYSSSRNHHNRKYIKNDSIVHCQMPLMGSASPQLHYKQKGCGQGSSVPALPPRLRHRKVLLSNLDAAVSAGIPTVKVRPLSLLDSATTTNYEDASSCGGETVVHLNAVGGGFRQHDVATTLSNAPPSKMTSTASIMMNTPHLLGSAADYGSAAEHLERLGLDGDGNVGRDDDNNDADELYSTRRRCDAIVGDDDNDDYDDTAYYVHTKNTVTTAPLFDHISNVKATEQNDNDNDDDDWRTALKNVDFTQDSLDRLKANALSLDMPNRCYDRRNRRKTTDSFTARSIHCLPEDEQSELALIDDGSDWRKTLGGKNENVPCSIPRDYDQSFTVNPKGLSFIVSDSLQMLSCSQNLLNYSTQCIISGLTETDNEETGDTNSHDNSLRKL